MITWKGSNYGITEILNTEPPAIFVNSLSNICVNAFTYSFGNSNFKDEMELSRKS